MRVKVQVLNESKGAFSGHDRQTHDFLNLGCGSTSLVSINANYFMTATENGGYPLHDETLKLVKEERQRRLPQATLAKLDRLKNLRAHKNPPMSYAELTDDMCEYMLKKLDPMVSAFCATPITDCDSIRQKLHYFGSTVIEYSLKYRLRSK